MVPDFAFQPEMQEVRKLLFAQATLEKCVCGEAKDADWPFCRSCCRRAKRINPRIIDAIRIRLHRGEPGGTAYSIALWCYDLAVDYLANAPRERRNKEEE